MARIMLIGGHGKVALLSEPMLVAAGHHVTAVIRNPRHEPAVRATGAEPLVADVETFDTEQLTNLVSGNDVVVCSAGAGGGTVILSPGVYLSGSLFVKSGVTLNVESENEAARAIADEQPHRRPR